MRSRETGIKKNSTVTVDITDITDLGFGVGRVDGKVIFISETVPGDKVEAKVIKVNSSYLIGKAEQFITKSSIRVTDRCKETGCKSCAYKNISYCEEAVLKEDGIRQLFRTDALAHIEVLPLVRSKSEARYRNKAQYPIAYEGGEYKIGFYAPKSHRVTPVSDCMLAPTVFGEIIAELKDYFSEYSLSVYDESTSTGLLRHIYLRRGEVSGEILLTLVINGDSIPAPEKLTERLKERFHDIVGILLNINKENTNIILGGEYKTLYGRDYIFDTLAGVRLKITAPSFYQVNHDTAELLYEKARELASPTKNDTLLDLYCGAGSIGLSMASDVKELIGIEIVDSAVKCAEENAKANNIENAHFFTGDAAETERLLECAERSLGRRIKPDIVILDPPRGGCDERLISFVASLEPSRIVYISCNPKTLARDIERFIKLKFDTDAVLPVDMFPGTGHVESVVCLTRRLDN